MRNSLYINIYLYICGVNNMCVLLANLPRAFSLTGITIGKPQHKRTLVKGFSNLCANETTNMSKLNFGNKSYLPLATKLRVQRWNEQPQMKETFVGTFSFLSLKFFTLVSFSLFSFKNI